MIASSIKNYINGTEILIYIINISSISNNTKCNGSILIFHKSHSVIYIESIANRKVALYIRVMYAVEGIFSGP